MIMALDRRPKPSPRRRRLPAACAALWLGLLAGLAAHARSAGCVDGSLFIDIAGDETVQVEVSIHGSLLRMIGNLDPELGQTVGGLESIYALVLDMSRLEKTARLDRVTSEFRNIERRLRKQGWERLAYVREEDGTVTVLILNSEEVIEGLLVMIVDDSDGTLVFANVCGIIDLAKIQELGEELGVPGLEDIPKERDD